MQKAYARIDEETVAYSGPPLADNPPGEVRIGISGRKPINWLRTRRLQRAGGRPDTNWWACRRKERGARAPSALVELMGQERLIGMIATDRNSSHLAEQLAVKMFVPLIALSGDRSLTSLNIPWIFRMPADAPVEQAVRTMAEATEKVGANRGRVRKVLASGAFLAGGVRFDARGEMR